MDILRVAQKIQDPSLIRYFLKLLPPIFPKMNIKKLHLEPRSELKIEKTT